MSSEQIKRRGLLSTVAGVLLGFGLCFMPTIVGANPTSVWTQHNDNSRSGDNLAETILTPANVNQNQFGLLFTYSLDDQCFAQPLYVPNLTMADGSTHNVVFVTSVNNSVYAFDGDTNAGSGGNALWHVNLSPAGERPPTNVDMDAVGVCGGGYTDFTGKMGIVGTPVIDMSRKTLYVVARTVVNGGYVQRLHALDITSGAERAGSPVTIAATVDGVSFDPEYNNQRPGLALVNGAVYILWASFCDSGPYRGWVIAYDGGTLQQVAAWPSTTTGGGAGIWQGGEALTADANSLYLMTGNGTWDGVSNFGESAVKLSPSLVVQDYFTPSNWSNLNGGDTDLGAAGLLGIPGTSYLIGGGKQGMVYLLNSANLGKEAGTDNVVQEFQATFPSGATGHIHGGPVYFNDGTSQYIYLWGENDYLRAYQFNGSSLNSTPVGLSTMLAPVVNGGMPGGFLSVSASGTSNGIVWALTPYDGDANHGTVGGILHAFNATPSGGVMTELWNSRQNVNRDNFGNFAKFAYPTISNGRVYVPTFGTAASGSGTLAVYGLLGSGTFIPMPPGSVTAQAGNAQVALNWVASSGATSYSIYRGTTPGGEGTTPIATGLTNTTYTDTGLTNGTQYYYVITATNSAGTSNASAEVGAMPSTNAVGMPYGGAPMAIPGTIQNENYDFGGEGVAYHDSDASNNGGQYRNEGVDIENCSDTGGGYDIGWTNAGEWLNYTVNVATAGAYSVTVRTASGSNGGSFHIADASGNNLSGAINVSGTGGWQNWTSVTATVTLPAGEQVIRLYEDTGGYNFNYMTFAPTTATAPSAPTNLTATSGVGQVSLAWTGSTGATSYNVYRGSSVGGESTTPIATGLTGMTYTDTAVTNGTTYYYMVAAVNNVGTSAMSNEASATPQTAAAGSPYGGTPWPIPGTVQSENYDLGGEGVGYHDSDATNSGGQYRNDGVDIENCGDTGGGYDVGWTNAGEWLNYTVNVSTAGPYTVTVRAASAGGGGSLHIANAGGTNLSGAITVPGTGGWQSYVNVTASVTLPAGVQTLRVFEDTGGYNLNYVSFASSTSIPPAYTDVTGQVSTTRGSVLPNLAGGGYYQNVSIKNTSAASIAGPIEMVITNLTSGVTVTNASGTFNGNPYRTATTSALAPGASVSVRIYYSNPANARFSYGVTVYSGPLK